MKMLFKEDFNKVLVANTEIPIQPNEVNYFVGLNGSGKTVTLSCLAHFLFNQTKNTGNWMTEPPKFLQKLEFIGFQDVQKVYHYTAKSRQSMFVDMDMVLSSVLSIGTLWASEGMHAQAEVVSTLKDKDNPNAFFIFDEIDGVLDARAKHIFFDQVLKVLKGTVVVATHETFYMAKKERVFDFTSGTFKTFSSYHLDSINGKLRPSDPVSAEKKA